MSDQTNLLLAKLERNTRNIPFVCTFLIINVLADFVFLLLEITGVIK